MNMETLEQARNEQEHSYRWMLEHQPEAAKVIAEARTAGAAQYADGDSWSAANKSGCPITNTIYRIAPDWQNSMIVRKRDDGRSTNTIALPPALMSDLSDACKADGYTVRNVAVAAVKAVLEYRVEHGCIPVVINAVMEGDAE